MKQKNYKLTTLSFANNLFFSSTVALALVCFERHEAQGNNAPVPGLAIARYALPTISTHTDPVNPTGTPVGAKVVELKKILQTSEAGSATLTQSTRDLYEKAITEVNQYYLATGEIEAKLQLGSTPANPKLIELRNQALQQLDQIANTIGQMNGLISGFSNTSQQVKVLISQTQATLQVPGAVDEDHAHLLLISSELKQLDGAIAQILNILTTNTQRQSEWLNEERIRFANLSSAIDRGQFKVPAQGLAINTVFPSPELLPDLKSHKKIHNAHKHPHTHSAHESSNLIKAELEKEPSSKKPISKTSPVPLTPAPLASYKMEPQSIEKGKVQPKTNPPSLSSTVHDGETSPKDKATKQLSKDSSSPLSLTPRTPDKAPLPKVTLEAHPKIQALPEKANASSEVKEEKQPVLSQKQQDLGATDVSYATAVNNRSPLGLLEPNQDVRSQKWTLFSSAKRGLKRPTDSIDIVSVGDGKKGQDVKNVLIEMGLKPDQIKVISAKAEEGQSGKIFLFRQ
ncbi:MAG: hypothetical protein K2P93_08855 [Alphaproteobacteria bacterium]|nr:hypothetical protein [Alphaproteobacteria bacterium]